MHPKILTALTLTLPLLATASPAALAASSETATQAEAQGETNRSDDSAKSMKDSDKTMDEAKNKDTSMDKADADDSDMKTASDIDYVTQQRPSEWTAQALIGRDVLNKKGEELGEVNNVIINESGSVVAVTIGVGGFLGLGEKDVGVPFDDLEFEAAAATKEADDSGKSTDEARTAQDQTTHSPSYGTALERFEREHDDTQVVLDATRSQLKNAPEFLWLDEHDDKRTEIEGKTTTR